MLSRPKRSIPQIAVLITVLSLVLILFLLLRAVISTVFLNDDGYDSAQDCTEYGIPPGDSLAQADPVMVATSSSFFGGGETESDHSTGFDAPWETDDFNEAEGVALGREFSGRRSSGSYHLFTRGVDFSQPVGMLVYLHGDGAEEYENPGGLSSCLAAVAEKYNLITLVPRTPDLRSMTWWQDLRENVEWVDSLVSEVSAVHGVDQDSIWWMGYSGGAELISYGLIPYRAESITGGAIMLGGGGAPEGVRLDVPVALREQLSLYWVTGQQDDGTDPRESFDAIEAAMEGARWYEERGFIGVQTSFPAAYDHFNLPQAAILLEILDAASGS